MTTRNAVENLEPEIILPAVIAASTWAGLGVLNSMLGQTDSSIGPVQALVSHMMVS